MFFKKSKNNSIQKKLVISYIAVILTVGFVISTAYYIYTISLLERQTLFAADSIQRLAEINLNLHKDNLEPLAEKFILSEAEHIANELSAVIKYMGGYNETKFKANKIIRSLIIKKIKANKEYLGDLIIVDKKRNIILASDPKMEGKNYDIIKNKYQSLFNLVSKGLSTKEFTGYYQANPLVKHHIKIKRKFLAGAQIPNTDLYVFSSVYVQPYMTPIIKKISNTEESEIKILIHKLDNLRNNSFITLILMSLFLLSALTLFSLFISNWLAKKISEPIISLKEAVLKLGKGNFEAHVNEKGTEETIELARTFNNLGNNLKNYIDNLASEIEHRKHIESEIEIAKNIQQSLLPTVSKDFTRKEFSLSAKLIPAEHVAGDFYDFFYLNEEKDKMAIILGDVSGKGIPAAFFMGIVRTVIRHQLTSHPDLTPDLLLSKINQLLCTDNDECMFVTLFIGMYNIITGKFTYGNAGHHSAIKFTADAKITEFGSLKNTMVGLFPNAKYNYDTITLKKEESILIYTDGLSEAISNDKQRFNVSGIEKILQQNYKKNPSEITNILFDKIINFQNNKLFDDMTALILKNNN